MKTLMIGLVALSASLGFKPALAENLTVTQAKPEPCAQWVGTYIDERAAAFTVHGVTYEDRVCTASVSIAGSEAVEAGVNPKGTMAFNHGELRYIIYHNGDVVVARVFRSGQPDERLRFKRL